MFKKVNREVADEALDQVFAETPEEELIDRAIAKRTRLRGRPKTRAEGKSLFDHLLRQGFPFELVAEKVRGAMQTELLGLIKCGRPHRKSLVPGLAATSQRASEQKKKLYEAKRKNTNRAAQSTLLIRGCYSRRRNDTNHYQLQPHRCRVCRAGPDQNAGGPREACRIISVATPSWAGTTHQGATTLVERCSQEQTWFSGNAIAKSFEG